MKIPDLTTYTILPQGGRACYLYINYLLVNMYTLSDKEWPLLSAAVGVSKNHHCRWYILPKQLSDVDMYLNSCLDSPYLEKIEATITKLRDEAVTKLAQKKGDLLFYFQSFQKIARFAGILRCIDYTLLQRFKEIYGDKADDMVQTLSLSE